MRREHENIKEFNNGNINVRYSPDQLALLRAGKVSAIEVLSWILDEIDCYFVGEHFCISNYSMGAMIYNAHSDLVYIINFSDIESVLMTGKFLKLYARTPDEIDRQTIESEGL